MIRRRRLERPSRRALLCASASALLLALVGAAPALAEETGRAWWQLSAITAPAHLEPGKQGQIYVTATDIGDANVNATGNKVTITDTLPAGLEAVENGSSGIAGSLLTEGTTDFQPGAVTCETHTSTVTCSFSGPKPLVPFVPLEVAINVKVNGVSSGAINEVAITGGGAPPVAVRRPLVVDSSGTSYGIENFEFAAENEGGGTTTQAGSHPFQLTTAIGINNVFVINPSKAVGEKYPKIPLASAETKDIVVTLPPGLVGNATTLPKCSEANFTAIIGFTNHCPANTAVGVATATLFEPEVPSFAGTGGVATATVPVFNLVPAQGEPARFGFDAYNNFVTLDTSVRTGEDYAVVTGVDNISEIASLLASSVTLWGVPGDQRHDQSRGWNCLAGGEPEGSPLCGSAEAPPPTPFLTLPGSCVEPLTSSLLADSWSEPGAHLPDGSIDTGDPRWKSASASSATLEGCNSLPFTPSISAQPETQAGSTPSGLNVDVHLPQVESANGLAEATVKDTTVTLPEGVMLNPGAAHGLEACSEAQMGYRGKGTFVGAETNLFTPARPSCPDGAKIASVNIKTPLLSHELEGSVYLAEPAPNGEPGKNPFESLVALYIVAEDPVSGVLVKLAGKVTLNGATGQATTTFQSTPQTPFEDLKMKFFGGPTASLTTPAYCGTYTTSATFTPWSGIPPVTEGSSFAVTSGCTPPGSNQPFAPSFQAGSNTHAAGAFTPFTLKIGNPDGDQALSGLTMHLPPGLAARISSVTPCPEPQASQNQCGPESLIGHSIADSGLGGDPFQLPGSVYLTGPYKGAPFGLSVVTPAIAGPFNLGDVTVRSTINVDRNTAAVTIVSDPFPTFIKGVPSQIKQIEVIVDRAGFQFNPTNCNPMAIGGTLTGVQGGVVAVGSPFQVSNCATLPFTPKLTASAGGHGTKAGGTGLNVNVTSAGIGQAGIAKVFLTIPKILPSRLTTIQKACVDAVFEQNPAACDEGSVIGHATIRTPVFKNPLMGPAYLVSHGNAGFPDVEFVLQGEGVTIVLDGKTDIKKGVTYSRFESAPDAPFTSFETSLPPGPHSALTINGEEAKNYEICSKNVTLPTIITGQNGAVIKQNTKVAISGCGAVKGFKASRSQLLAKALAKCRKQFKHNKRKRATCEAAARKRYAAKKASKRKGKH